MSQAEYNLFCSGEEVRNNSRHIGYRTTSIGFCFFVENPEEAIHWLSGCCDPEQCVTLEIDEKLLQKTTGHYRNPKGGTIDRTEYCCTSYSLRTARLLAVTDKYRGLAEMRKALRLLGLIW
jgi:hypothetical protein